jgi:hypothetical protein
MSLGMCIYCDVALAFDCYMQHLDLSISKWCAFRDGDARVSEQVSSRTLTMGRAAHHKI